MVVECEESVETPSLRHARALTTRLCCQGEFHDTFIECHKEMEAILAGEDNKPDEDGDAAEKWQRLWGHSRLLDEKRRRDTRYKTLYGLVAFVAQMRDGSIEHMLSNRIYLHFKISGMTRYHLLLYSTCNIMVGAIPQECIFCTRIVT
jgi:hypothetical protein